MNLLPYYLFARKATTGPPLGSAEAVEFMLEDTVMENVWFMPKATFCSVDYEYSVNGGGAWTSTSGNVIDLKGKVIAIGDLHLRAKNTVEVSKNKKAFTAPSISYSAPVTISAGGTYTGNWRSTSATTPAVNVTTSDPVIFDSCNIESVYIGLNAQYGAYDAALGRGAGVNITVRNCRFKGLPIPDGTVLDEGRWALRVAEPIHVVIENNHVENCLGFKVGGEYRGNGTNTNTIKIRYNRGVNLDCRIDNGTGRKLGNFINWFETVHPIPAVEIAWNHMHQHDGKSDIEDGFNLSGVQATAAEPAKIHHNMLRGLNYYNWQATDAAYSNGFFSGVSIMVESLGSPTKETCAKYIDIEDNYFMDSNNGFVSVHSAEYIRVVRNTSASKAMADKENITAAALDGGEYKGYSGDPTYYTDATYNLGSADGVVFDSNRRAVAQDYRISENKNTALASGRMDAHYAGGTAVTVQETNPVYLFQGVAITEEQVNEMEREFWVKVAANGLTIGPVAVTVTAAPAA